MEDGYVENAKVSDMDEFFGANHDADAPLILAGNTVNRSLISNNGRLQRSSQDMFMRPHPLLMQAEFEGESVCEMSGYCCSYYEIKYEISLAVNILYRTDLVCY